jgi:hypothetical protein
MSIQVELPKGCSFLRGQRNPREYIKVKEDEAIMRRNMVRWAAGGKSGGSGWGSLLTCSTCTQQTPSFVTTMTKQEIMQRQPHIYRNLLFGMACGDAILYMVFRGESEFNDTKLLTKENERHRAHLLIHALLQFRTEITSHVESVLVQS